MTSRSTWRCLRAGIDRTAHTVPSYCRIALGDRVALDLCPRAACSRERTARARARGGAEGLRGFVVSGRSRATTEVGDRGGIHVIMAVRMWNSAITEGDFSPRRRSSQRLTDFT